MKTHARLRPPPSTTRALARMLVVGVALTTSLAASSSQVPRAGARLAFVTCPIVRDTKTLPCWLAEYRGETYYLGTQGSSSSAFYPPQLQHEVLVEAVVGDGPRVCGGVPLSRVHVSVRPEITPSCNTVLPAEPELAAPPSPPAPIPAFADTTREFTIPYDFDSDYHTLHTTRIVAEIARIATLVAPSRIDVRARRGATRLTDGAVIVERAEVAQGRATRVRAMLVGLGVPDVRVRATWTRDADRPDGVHDVERRAVVVTLGR